MSKMIFVSAILMFSNLCFANLLGRWQGIFSYENVLCQPATIEITQKDRMLTIKGSDLIECGTHEFALNQSYVVSDGVLYKGNSKMGQITDKSLDAQDRIFQASGDWRYWDFVTMLSTVDGQAAISLNFGDDDLLTGEFTQK